MLAESLAQYGYLVVAIGAFLEGETVLLLAGYAAQQGALDLAAVLVLGIAGAFAGDQLWFHLARRHGARWLARRPQLVAKTAGAMRLLERHATLFILSFRFIYGLRNLGAVAVAMSAVTTRRFVILNLIAAILWSVLVIGAGYVFGEAASAMLDNLAGIEKQVLAVTALVAVAALASLALRHWLLRWLS